MDADSFNTVITTFGYVAAGVATLGLAKVGIMGAISAWKWMMASAK